MKKSIIFGVMAMFAISALSIQNVNAQNEVGKKSDQKVVKEEPNAGQSNQAINMPKEKPQQSDQEYTTTKNAAPSQGTNGSVNAQGIKGKMKKGNETIKNDAQQNNANGNNEPQVKDKQKGGVKVGEKKDANANEPAVRDKQKGGVKVGEKSDANANEPTMRNAQPQEKPDVQVKKKEMKPEYNSKDEQKLKKMDATVGKKLKNKDANAKPSNLAKPKIKKEQNTTTQNGNEEK